ncbi:MAG TPA: low molecular weight protein arginine phosphatase [Longimicrobium sp.]|nr:low molecular weight protein arginine phosphatase [Longimicrobium sp.]
MTQQDAEPDAPRTTVFRILFVCTGNTCRSPLAEGIARDEIGRRGWKHVEVASAGLSAGEGQRATRAGVVVAGRAGIDLKKHRSRQLTPALAASADLILAMGPGHVAELRRLGAGERAATLGDFAAGAEGVGPAVQDPFGGSEAVYEETFHELRGLVSAALDRLEPVLAP